MAEAMELRQYQQFRGIEGAGTTTSEVVTNPLADEIKNLRALEGNVLRFWTSCSANTAIRSDLPLAINTAAQSISAHVQNLALILVWSSQSVELRANIRPVERTNRSEAITFPWDISTQEFKDQFHCQLSYELELEPVEDGISHPVERVMQELLTNSSRIGSDWIKTSFQRLVEEKKEVAAAGLLQCIGRIKSEALNDIVGGLVSQGLAHGSAQVREAAISIVEQIADTDLTSLLSRHSDSVPWLNLYAERVLKDLA